MKENGPDRLFYVHFQVTLRSSAENAVYQPNPVAGGQRVSHKYVIAGKEDTLLLSSEMLFYPTEMQ
ncbi:hypothetical protein [Sediminibacterium ginsengisoli]|uniref:hypothetical protein n=1 Tax=Sediminibacterium ginsengisoli TaxID=413434 RepID=UPI00099DCDD9|nr:hypothetical protein [Sediminibacterium ginsengisoli]